MFSMQHDYRTVKGSELKGARIALGASIKDVADALGLDRATVWRWERSDKEHGQLDAARYMAALDRIAKGATE